MNDEQRVKVFLARYHRLVPVVKRRELSFEQLGEQAIYRAAELADRSEKFWLVTGFVLVAVPTVTLIWLAW